MILLLGPPGAGKSVQSGLLGAALGYASISTGVLLRTTADESLQARMLKGDLIEDEIVQDLVAQEVLKHQPIGALILDGFPRTASQAEWLAKWAKENNVVIECLLHVTLELEICKKRLLSRGRTDDVEEVIEHRYQEYKDVSVPIIEFMVDAEVPILTVDGTQSIELVHKLVMAQIGQRRTSL